MPLVCFGDFVECTWQLASLAVARPKAKKQRMVREKQRKDSMALGLQHFEMFKQTAADVIRRWEERQDEEQKWKQQEGLALESFPWMQPFFGNDAVQRRTLSSVEVAWSGYRAALWTKLKDLTLLRQSSENSWKPRSMIARIQLQRLMQRRKQRQHWSRLGEIW